MKKITKVPRTIEEHLECAITSADNIAAMEELAGMEAWQFIERSMEDDIVAAIDKLVDLCDAPVQNEIAIVVEKTKIALLSKILRLKNGVINKKPQLQAEVARLMAAKIQKPRESA